MDKKKFLSFMGKSAVVAAIALTVGLTVNYNVNAGEQKQVTEITTATIEEVVNDVEVLTEDDVVKIATKVSEEYYKNTGIVQLDMEDVKAVVAKTVTETIETKHSEGVAVASNEVVTAINEDNKHLENVLKTNEEIDAYVEAVLAEQKSEMVDEVKSMVSDLASNVQDGKDGVDGRDGKDGVDGRDGKDGVDGLAGVAGKDGLDGKDGITPVKGVDYFTEEDITDIKDTISAEMKEEITSDIKNTIAEELKDTVTTPVKGVDYFTEEDIAKIVAEANKQMVSTDDLVISGESAYDVAVDNGFEGSEEEWVNSLKGESAYDIAVNNGFEGSEEEWLESLKGTGTTVVEPQGPSLQFEYDAEKNHLKLK